ncbi:MAG: NAD-dependent epimerase/dehydratase family protein [Faecousia sp.]
MNDNRIYLLTGAAGFLGSNICLQLLEKGCKVRALVLPGDKSVKFIPKEVEVVFGDLTDADSLEPFFTVPEGCSTVIIHCASMVTVDPNYSEKLMAVNVGGTRNIITKVLGHPECEKMVYVSSTGAIPELPHGTKIKEVDRFEPCDPKKVVGAYSQSKAKATQMVLDAVRVMGLKACVVHPSGILGPNDHAIGETTRTLLQIIKGEMPMGMQGSFNLCDVRDLAAGTIAAVDKGRVGECYILANEPVTLKEMCDMLHAECSAKEIKFYLPLGLAEKLAQGLEKQAEKTGKKPMMTTFSVYNLARNNEFDYSKAQNELGYTTRSYQQTIHDEVQWMIAEGLVEGQTVPTPTMVTNAEIRESGAMPQIIGAMEHDIAGLADVDAQQVYEAIEHGVVDAYKKIESGVVGAYQKIEDGVVGTYGKMEDRFVERFLTKEGESVEEAKERLRKQDKA